MGLYAAGEVVFLSYPFSDLSRSKLRPAVLVAYAGQDDWVACQITSNPFIDPFAIPLDSKDFATGGLKHLSYLRPGKLFTAHESIFAANVGALEPAALLRTRDAIVEIVRGTKP